jgi:hypothetical protein
MDFLESVFAFAHLVDGSDVDIKIVTGAQAYRIQERYHISYKYDKETKQRTCMIDQVGLSNFASDYKKFYNRSGNTDKDAIKNDILNAEVRPVVDEKTADNDVCFRWQPMKSPPVMWPNVLNRAIRGYILVVDAPHAVLIESFAYKVIYQELPFIEAVINLIPKFEDVSKKKEETKK